MPNEPLVAPMLQRNNLLVGQLGQIARRNATEDTATPNGIAIHDLKNPPPRLIALLLLVVVALTRVGPVGNIDAAVGAVLCMEAAEPGVLGEREVGRVLRDVAAALRLKDVAIEPLAVD